MVHRYCALIMVMVACLAPLARAEVIPITGWDRQVFPSYLIATATLKNAEASESNTIGDAYSAFGVAITAPADNTPVKVRISVDGYARDSEISGVLPTKGEVYRVFPKMQYNFDKLAACRQATPCIAVFHVEIGGQTEELTSTITIRSVNDCPFSVVLQDGVEIDQSVVFAAYVNEQHPFVDRLLRETLDIGRVDSFVGYQAPPKQVLAQVYALWDLMVMRDMRYSSITATAAVSTKTRSQHVRLLEETINNTQANCVDGSVLFASMLRKVGIDSVLVVTADHCYVAFWADAQHELLYGLETTMVSLATELEETPEALQDVISEDYRWDYSWASFVSALGVGCENLQRDIDPKATEVTLINIAQARLQGILPIPFDGQQEFLPGEFEFEDVELVSQDDEAMSDDDFAEEDTEEDESDDLEWDSSTKQRRHTKRGELEWE